MTTQELEQVIQEYFLNIYGKQYIGKLSIQKLNPVGYYIKFGMDRTNRPTVIYAEMDDTKFLKFLKQQIKDMRLNNMYNGILKLKYYTNCNPINTSCSCHDKGRINREN